MIIAENLTFIPHYNAIAVKCDKLFNNLIRIQPDARRYVFIDKITIARTLICCWSKMIFYKNTQFVLLYRKAFY